MTITYDDGKPKVVYDDKPEKPKSVEAPKPERPIPGDFGAMLSSGQALDAVNKYIEHLAYKGGGGATDIASKVMSPESAAKVGLATNVGIQAVPTFLGGEAAKVAEPAFNRIARFLMTSALKPDKFARESGKGAQAVQTLLEQGANVTEGGVTKLRGKIDKLNDEIATAVASNKGTVSKDAVVEYLLPNYEAALKQTHPEKDLKVIKNMATEFLDNHPMLKGQDEIPVQLAQAIKQGNYKALGDKAYGLGLKPEAERDALKAITHGLKEEIAKTVPGIDKLNAEESKLLNAEMLAQSRVLLDANKNPIGMGWIASHPVETIAWMLDRSPLFKSLVARAAYSGSEQIPANVGRIIGGAVGATSGSPGFNRTLKSTQQPQQ